MYRQIKVLKYFIVVVGILKADVIEYYLALDILKLRGIRLIEYLNLGIHKLQESVDTRDTHLELLHEIHYTSHRRKKRRHIKQERHQVRRLYHTVVNKQTPGYKRHQIYNRIEHLNARMKPRHHHVVAFLKGKEKFVALGKFSFFQFLIGKGLNNLMTKKRVLYGCIKFTYLCSLKPPQPSKPHINPAAYEHHDRYDGKDNKCKIYVNTC